METSSLVWANIDLVARVVRNSARKHANPDPTERHSAY
jgi:hypothetical protein